MIFIRNAFLGFLLTAIIAMIPLAAHSMKGYLRPPALPDDEKADAVMVFTGTPDRLVEGYSSYIEGEGDKLMISGFDYPKQAKEPQVRKLAQKARRRGKVYVDLQARNTIENARNGAAWALRNHVKSIMLVTTEDHMPRAFFELRRLLPENIEVYANAVPGKRKADEKVDTEKNRFLCRLYETAIDTDFCYQTRELIRALDGNRRS